jgi:hypothetical protein
MLLAEELARLIESMREVLMKVMERSRSSILSRLK